MAWGQGGERWCGRTLAAAEELGRRLPPHFTALVGEVRCCNCQRRLAHRQNVLGQCICSGRGLRAAGVVAAGQRQASCVTAVAVVSRRNEFLTWKENVRPESSDGGSPGEMSAACPRARKVGEEGACRQRTPSLTGQRVVFIQLGDQRAATNPIPGSSVAGSSNAGGCG